MSVDLIQYAFVAGEISETFFGRTDLEKYDLGLALAHNWFVDYRGGVSTRAGTEVVDHVMDDDQPTKFVPFRFAPNLANTYVILFGHNYIRFIQDGSYLLEASKTITAITQATPGVVTANAHGFTTGDWVVLDQINGMIELNNRIFEVGVTATNTFELVSPTGGALSTVSFAAYASSGRARRVYTVVSPYAGSDLAGLKAKQIRDYIRLTHGDYPTKNLIRASALSWSISDESIGNDVTRPTGVSATASAAGTASVAFGVTAIDANGVESLLSDIEILTSAVNYSSTAGSVTVTWTPVAGAKYYNIYRSTIFPGSGASATAVTRAAQLGFLGQSYGPTFTDTNIIPDFAQSAPQGKNPFADGTITDIEVTAGGASYVKDDTVSVSGGGGSGFVGFPIVDDAGAIIAVVIQNGGSGYSSPVVSFGTSGGSGATADATAGSATGNYPSVSARFQQRQLYAASDNFPLRIWGSRPGQTENFDVSEVLTDGDAFTFDIESDEVSKIEHLVPSRQGLLVFSRSGLWRLHGGSEIIVTPLNRVADPQSSRGASEVNPLEINSDILYVEGKSLIIRLISYNDLTKVFDGVDASILSNHLFSDTKQIEAWDYAQNPYNVVWAVRTDGALLSFTLVKDQEVFAWTPNTTKGLFRDVVVVQENGLDRTYLMVERYVNGRWTKFIERMAVRTFDEVEDAWCVDCGVSRALTMPAIALTLSAASGDNVTVTAASAAFTAVDIGKVLFAGGGKATVINYLSPTQLKVNFERAVTDLVPETTMPMPVVSGNWSLDRPRTSFSGLWHLEGETVRILGDGNVFPEQTVVNGSVTLPNEVTKVVVGLGYDCIAKTLPPVAQGATIEARTKNIIGISARVYESRGLQVGPALDRLREHKEWTTEGAGVPISLKNEVQATLIDPEWNTNGQTYIVQTHPLPATLLGIVKTMEVGDDPN